MSPVCLTQVTQRLQSDPPVESLPQPWLGSGRRGEVSHWGISLVLAGRDPDTSPGSPHASIQATPRVGATGEKCESWIERAACPSPCFELAVELAAYSCLVFTTMGTDLRIFSSSSIF